MNTVNNVRFQSTEDKIKDALFRLLRFRKFNEIYIKELCYEAGINRSSFYAHYQDINDLMIKIESKLSHEIDAIFPSAKAYERADFVRLFEFLYKNKDFYRAYLQTGEGSALEKMRFFDDRVDKYRKNPSHGYSGGEFVYHMVFFAGGLKSISKYWLLSGAKESPDTLADYLFNEYKNTAKYFS